MKKLNLAVDYMHELIDSGSMFYTALNTAAKKFGIENRSQLETAYNDSVA